jgi:hypothetical protein
MHSITCSSETVLQQEAQRLHQRFEERSANMRLVGTGLRVTLAEARGGDVG